MLGGGILLMTLPDHYWNTQYVFNSQDQKKYDNQYMKGVVLTSIGVGLLATGITISSAAGRSMKRYQARSGNLTLKLNGAGVMLTYKF